MFLVFALAACSAPAVKREPVTTEAPAWFRGAWKLEWEAAKGQPRSAHRIVRDLQTPAMFGSFRMNLDRPAFSGVKSFEDLDDAQLAILLRQRGGFAGTATFKGDVALWDHEIDFQPPDTADTAHLKQLTATTVLEESPEGGRELWWSMSSGDGKYLAIKVATGKRTERILVVVGDHFVYARNRARDLPRADSLVALATQTTATRAQIIELLDCEVSYGTVRSGRVPWEVRFSTLPWLESKSLEPARSIVIDASGAPSPRTPTPGWSLVINTFDPQDLVVLFPPAV